MVPLAASDGRGSLCLRDDLSLAFEQDGAPVALDFPGTLGVALSEEHLLLLGPDALRLVDRDTRALSAVVPVPGERRFLVTSSRGVCAVGTSEGVFVVADGDPVKLPVRAADEAAFDALAESLCLRADDELVLVDVVELTILGRSPVPEGATSLAHAPGARAFAVAVGSGVRFFAEGDLAELGTLTPAEPVVSLRATESGELEGTGAGGATLAVGWLAGGGGATRKRLRARVEDAASSPLHLAAALAFVAAVVLLPLSKAGIWDPWELDAAELARRIAEHGRGPDAEPLPTLGDLRSGELPFTSMAVGFRWFGLHDWSGRLPLALWALGSAVVAFGCVRRLAGARAALYAALILGSSPLFFLHARIMLGDAVTMAAALGSFSLLVAAFSTERLAARVALGAGGALLLAAGWLSRGWLLGVAPVALAAGFAPLLARPQRASRLRDLAAASLVALGLYATARGVRLLGAAEAGGVLVRGLGVAVVAKPDVDGTFDLPIRQLGHALFPLSALLPLAFGRLLRAPTHVYGEARHRETLLRTAVLLALGTSFAAHALLAARVGQLPFSGVGFAALALALVLRDLDRGAPASGALGIGTAALAFVLHRDLTQQPARTLAAFAVSKPPFPQGFEHTAKVYLTVAAVPLLVLVALAWLEQPAYLGRSLREQLELRAKQARALLRELVTIWDGNAFFALVVVEAALIGLGGMVFIGRKVAWAPTLRMSDQIADLSVNLWWVVPLAAVGLPALFVAARDALRLIVARSRVGRGGATVGAVAAAGLVLALGYYPALGAQLSPKDAFAAYVTQHKAGEPLAVLGVRASIATYYGAAEVEAPSDPSSAFSFLGEGPGRRWLVLRAEDLPRLNSLHRRRHGQNLPVLDASSALVLLASSELGGSPNSNPLGDVVLDDDHPPRFKLDATLEDSLEVQGWEVTDEGGRLLDTVLPQRPFHVRVHYRVIGPVTGAWKGFLHVDKSGLRHTADHALTEGRYPAALWQPGDRIVDEYTVTLEPNFVPGDYPLYFGLFAGDARMKVSKGLHVEDRVAAGSLRVR